MTATIFLFKSMSCSALLYLFYWLALRGRKNNRFNRVFLLSIVVISLALPFLHIHVLQANTDTTDTVIQLVQASSSHAEWDNATTASGGPYDHATLALVAYTMVSTILLLIASLKIAWVYRLKQKGSAILTNGVKMIVTNSGKAPFSFLSLIFWRDGISPDSDEGRRILDHELAHARQWHTLDKLFIQAIIICCWINPVYWLIQRELSLVHEYLADEAAIEDQDTDAFARVLLHTHYGYIARHIVNPFYYSSIKKRIVMLNKTKTTSDKLRRYAALPMLAGTIALFSFTAKNSPHGEHERKITIVLDAGHGGNDAGAVAANGTKEKDLNLRVCQRLATLAATRNMNVVMTRATDDAVTLAQRTRKANAEHGQVFLSIHVNSDADGKRTNGLYEVVVSGKNANVADSRLLASAIVPRLRSQGLTASMSERGLYVLNNSDMPSVLIECGDINDAGDVALLNDNAKLDDLCNNILKGVERFRSAK